VLITRPYFCFLKCGHAALAHLYAPSTCTFITKSQSWSFMFLKLMSRRMPALLMRTSILPKALIAVSMILSPFSTES